MSLLKTKFFSIYQYLDKIEKRQFLAFVQSPFFNNNNHVIKFCSLLNNVKEFNMDALDKQKVYNNVFGGSAYKDLKIRHLVSASFKLL